MELNNRKNEVKADAKLTNIAIEVCTITSAYLKDACIASWINYIRFASGTHTQSHSESVRFEVCQVSDSIIASDSSHTRDMP